MTTVCNHAMKPFGYNPFGKDKEPTSDEISKHKLWKCPKCQRWYSFLHLSQCK